MEKKYTHLSYEERVVLNVRWRQKASIRQIAWELGRDPVTVSRELRRNEQFKATRLCYPIHAQMKANGRRRRAYRKPRLKSRGIQTYVEKKLRLGWSPEIIAGVMKNKSFKQRVSHEAIYQWIYKKRPDLRGTLVRHHKRRKKKGQSKRHKGRDIPSRICISRRPANVEKRNYFGHWESDSLVTDLSKACLHVAVERKSRYVCITKIPRNTSQAVKGALIHRLYPFPKAFRRTITYDNGKENVQHVNVNQHLGTKSYFCRPYHSWEKGTVENTIGLIRRRIPKRTDVSPIPVQDIQGLEIWLNSRPRKCLDFKTSLEVLKEQSVALQC